MCKKIFFLFLTLFLGILPALAVDQLAYTSIPITLFHSWKILIPKDPKVNRIYVVGRVNSHIVSAKAVVDEHALVPAIGTSKTTSIPASLLEGHDHRFTEVIAFPKETFTKIAHSMTFEVQHTDGKLAHYQLKQKQLREFLNAFH